MPSSSARLIRTLASTRLPPVRFDCSHTCPSSCRSPLTRIVAPKSTRTDLDILLEEFGNPSVALGAALPEQLVVPPAPNPAPPMHAPARQHPPIIVHHQSCPAAHGLPLHNLPAPVQRPYAPAYCPPLAASAPVASYPSTLPTTQAFYASLAASALPTAPAQPVVTPPLPSSSYAAGAFVATHQVHHQDYHHQDYQLGAPHEAGFNAQPRVETEPEPLLHAMPRQANPLAATNPTGAPLQCPGFVQRHDPRCPRRSANRGSSRVAGGGSRGSVARGGEGSSSVPGVHMRRQLSGVEEEPEAEVGVHLSVDLI